jgi:hypothetical protein
MQRRKSARHVNAARARWRMAEARAAAEREDGIPDDPLPVDARQPFDLDLRTWGGPWLRIEPRAGYIAARAIDAASGAVLTCCALKTLLHNVADRMPRTASCRSTPHA